jgi:hypothetical protein
MSRHRCGSSPERPAIRPRIRKATRIEQPAPPGGELARYFRHGPCPHQEDHLAQLHRLDWLLSHVHRRSQMPGRNCPRRPAFSGQGRAKRLIAASECGGLALVRGLPKTQQGSFNLLPTPKRRQPRQTQLLLAPATGLSVGVTSSWYRRPSINTSLPVDAESRGATPDSTGCVIRRYASTADVVKTAFAWSLHQSWTSHEPSSLAAPIRDPCPHRSSRAVPASSGHSKPG